MLRLVSHDPNRPPSCAYVSHSNVSGTPSPADALVEPYQYTLFGPTATRMCVLDAPGRPIIHMHVATGGGMRSDRRLQACKRMTVSVQCCQIAPVSYLHSPVALSRSLDDT